MNVDNRQAGGGQVHGVVGRRVAQEAASGTKDSCECEGCQNACRLNPGWFMPGEAEQTAAHLGISLEELFKQHLGVNWYVGDEDTFVLAPAITSMDAGGEYPGDPRGTCVFFKEGRCQIQGAKPFECREYLHDQTKEDVSKRHKEVAETWNTPEHQQQIVRLLGREPEAESFSIFDMLLGGFGIGL